MKTAEQIIDENTFVKDGLITVDVAVKCMKLYAEQQGQTLPLDSVSQRSELLNFIDWWNNLDDESDDKLYMTDETIKRFKS